MRRADLPTRGRFDEAFALICCFRTIGLLDARIEPGRRDDL
jgi:hypothetical protein